MKYENATTQTTSTNKQLPAPAPHLHVRDHACV